MVSKYQRDHPWTSVNGTLKEIRKLQTDRRYRDARGAFFIEGIRNFVQAADHHFDILVIVYSEKLLTSPLARKLVRQFRRSGIPTINIRPEKFRKFSQTKRASGVSAIISQQWTQLESLSLKEDLFWVVLGLVRSPGNLGTLIRTSEAAGGSGFILLDRRVDAFAPATVRASMSAHFRQRFVNATYTRLKTWIKNNDVLVIGASPDGPNCFQQFKYPRPTLLVLGEERGGLSPQQRSLCDHLVSIPMVGQADSLNLGVAGSLLMYEIYRVNEG